MTIQDVNQLLAIMKANYSYAFKAMSPDERYMLLGTWAVTLQDLPADVVMLAVMQLVSQSKWMPTVAEIREKCREIHYAAATPDTTFDMMLANGIFKRFCERAERPAAVVTNDYGIGENPSIWKVSLDGTGDNPIRSECLKKGHIRIGWDEYGESITDTTDFSQYGGRVVLNSFINRMQIGDIVLSCYSASTIDAIGVVTGDCEWHDEYPRLKRLRKVNWIVKDIKENILSLNGGTAMTLASVYRMGNVSLTDVYQLIDKHNPATAAAQPAQKNYVFIIDEINRGNISKIFGELITLIEESKRVGKPEGMTARLPNSQKLFGVPDWILIKGTGACLEQAPVWRCEHMRRYIQHFRIYRSLSVAQA